MIDRLLTIGGTFDWIGPAWATIQDAAHGGGHTLAVNLYCGRSPVEIERILRRRGVKTWGLMIDQAEGCIYVSCPRGQAAWATQILEHAGIPVLSGAVAAHNGPAGTPPKPRRLVGRSRLWQLLDGR